MKNKEIIECIKKSLDTYIIVNWEIETKDDFVSFLFYMFHTASYNPPKLNIYGISICDLLPKHEWIRKILDDLNKKC